MISLAGALPLALYHPAYFRSWRHLIQHVEFRGLFAVSLAAIIILMACMSFVGHLPWASSVYHAPLLALSAQTTVGFSSMEIAALDVASNDETGTIAALELPSQTRIICLYRDGDMLLPEDDTEIEADDELVVITRRDNMDKLTKRWSLRHPRR